MATNTQSVSRLHRVRRRVASGAVEAYTTFRDVSTRSHSGPRANGRWRTARDTATEKALVSDEYNTAVFLYSPRLTAGWRVDIWQDGETEMVVDDPVRRDIAFDRAKQKMNAIAAVRGGDGGASR